MDYKSQDTPGVFKRLDFEELGGDDYSRYVRVQKGLIREAVTPKYTVPLSREGTDLHTYIDRNEITAAVKARNSLIMMVTTWYPVVLLQRAFLSYITNNTVVKQLIQVSYIHDAGAVSPEVYTNG